MVFLSSTEVMKASQQAIERGVKDCLFIDYKRRSGHFDVTTVASIKEITEKVLFYGSLILGEVYFYEKGKWCSSIVGAKQVWSAGLLGVGVT